jgi:5-methylcytosine-specific restriction protein A
VALKPPTYRRPGAPTNERERKAMLDRRRPNRTDRGYDAAWHQLRARFIRLNPMCCIIGCSRRAEEIDHVIPIRDRPELRLDWSNLRPLCRHHHSQHTARTTDFARRGPRDDLKW